MLGGNSKTNKVKCNQFTFTKKMKMTFTDFSHSLTNHKSPTKVITMMIKEAMLMSTEATPVVKNASKVLDTLITMMKKRNNPVINVVVNSNKLLKMRMTMVMRKGIRCME